MVKTEERFSLKDHLFNKEKVQKISKEIAVVYPSFQQAQFEKTVLKEFPKQELLERVYWICDQLHEFLPQDYRTAIAILLKSLPEPCDPAKTDDDFGDFIYAPHSYFVAEYGLNKKDLPISLKALKELTTRFSVEGAIRFFINQYPEQTLRELKLWAKNRHYHVRRAASEGTRPFLPWAKKIEIDYTEAIPILDILYTDKTRFVTRSVANHVNDISKIDPTAAVELLKKWQKEGKQDKKEMEFMTTHALRTLVKEGHQEALKLLGYDGKHVHVKNFKLHTTEIPIGGTLEFSFDLVSTVSKSQDVMIDYILYFNKANGTLAPKTHKITKKKLRGKETLHIEKKHPLRIMTTRKLYPGRHEIELQINGIKFGKMFFLLL